MHLRKRGKRRLIALLSVILLAAIGVFVFKVIGNSQQQRLFENARINGLAAYAQSDYKSTLDELKYCVQYDKNDIEVLLAFADARRHLPLINDKHLHEAVSYYDFALGLLGNEEVSATANEQKRNALGALLDLREALGYRFELLEVADQLLELEPDYIPALRAKVGALVSDRQFDDASPDLDRLIALEPSNLKWRKWKLQLLRLQGDAEEQLLSQCDQWITEQPDNAQFRLIKAQQLAQFGHHIQAKLEAEAAVAKGVESLSQLQSLVALLDGLGGQDAATKAIDDAKRKFPEETWVHQAAIRRLWRNGQIALALAEIKEAESVLNELDPYLLRLKTSALLANDEINQARNILNKLSNLSENVVDAEAHRSWARAVEMNIREVAPNAQKQIEQLFEAISLNPDDAILVLILAGVYADQGERNKALQAYAEAYALDRHWLQASAGYTRSLLDAGRVQEAFIIASDLFTLAPPSLVEPYVLFAEAYLAIHHTGNTPAVTLRSTGRQFDLVMLLEKLHERVPNESQVASLLCEAYIVFEHQNKAVALINQKISASDVDPEVLLALARISKRFGLQFEQALLQKAQQLDNSNLEIIFAQARVLADDGKIEAAKSLINRSLSLLSADIVSSEAGRVGYVKFLLHINDPSAPSQLASLVTEFSKEPSVQSFVLAQNLTWNQPELVDKAISNLKAVLGSNAHQVRLARASKIVRYNSDDEAQLAEGVAILAGVLEQSPESLVALSLLAEAYTHTTPPSLKQAIGYLKQAIELYPVQVSLYPRLISLLQQQGEYETASSYLIRFGELASHDLNLIRVEIKLLTAQGEFDAAVARASSLAQTSSLESDKLSLAALYQRTGRLHQVQTIYDQLLLKQEPGSFVIVQAASFYASIGNSDKADALIDSLSLDDVTATTAGLLGRYYQRQGDLELSEHWLRKAVSKQPRLADAWQALAQNYLKNNDSVSAYEAVVDGLKASPKHRGLQDLFAVSVMKQDVHAVERAIEQLQRLDTPATSLLATLKLLKIIRQAGDKTPPTPEHMEKAQELISDNATFLPAWILAITISERAGELSNAAELARKASKRFPSRAEPSQWATKLLMRTQHWDEALWQAQEWRDRSLYDPSTADKAAAKILLELGRYADAVERMRPYAKSIIAHHKDYPDHLSLWIRALMLDGYVDEAFIIMKPLLVDAKWCRFWLALSQIIDPVDAESALRLTEANVLADSEIALQLAASWSDLGARTGQSKMQLAAERLIDNLKDSISVQLVQGRIAEAREDWIQAEAIYRKVINQDQNNLAALNNLAFVLCQATKASSEALEFVKRALVLAPDHPDILDTYALVLIEFESYSDAQQALMHAHARRPNDAAISLSLAETTLKMGQTDEAWQMLQDIERKLSIKPAIDPKLQIRANKLRELINEAQASVEVLIGQ